MTDLYSNYMNSQLYRPGEHDQQELDDLFGDPNKACDFTAIYNNLEKYNNVARSPGQFLKDAESVKAHGLILGNGKYREDKPFNDVRADIATFLNKAVFGKNVFGANESVSFSFVDKSKINEYTIIQNTTLVQNNPLGISKHFVNTVSVNGNMLIIRDTFNGKIKSLDLNDKTGFTNDKSWFHSFTNMNFY